MTLRRTTRSAALIGLALLLAGCAAIQRQEAEDAEQALAAAGFRIKLADTPEKLAHLKTLRQRKVVPHQNNGVVRFTYADATYCKCLYVGDERAYRRYQRLALQRRISENLRTAAVYNANASMNWSLWGPWGPGGPWGPWGPPYY